jgi:DNA repair protein RecO (recombination protein O)
MTDKQVFHAEGIVLKAIAFKEQDKIITLFTRDAGLLKLYVRGTHLRAPSQNVLTQPLTVGEYFFTEGRGELFHFYDGSIVEQNLHLRTSLEALQLADKMIGALHASQLPEKPAPALYQLISHFLRKIDDTVKHQSVLSTFLLKILSHDGVLQARLFCSTCQKPLEKQRLRYAGESFCASHAPHDALPLTIEEEGALLNLAQIRSFQEISTIVFSEELSAKVERLFNQAVHN